MRQQPELKVEDAPTGSLVPYANNAKTHTGEQIDQICSSIEEFGFNDPVGVWDGPEGLQIVEGHGRVMAAGKLGLATVPVVRLNHLSDEQRRAYALAHNKLTMNTGWDMGALSEELGDLSADFDMSDFGFGAAPGQWDGSALSTEGREGDAAYEEFTAKFEPKLTTDDCYTPPAVYDAVRAWACAEYGIDPESCVRPFFPGGDFERYDYPEGCTVLDNPPFSIMSRIIDFYEGRGIPYFLFGPQLTLFSGNRGCNYVCANCDVVYENGAAVATGFVTSYGKWKVDTAPELHEAVEEAQRKARDEAKGAPMNSWQLPEHVVTAAMAGKLGKRGIRLRIGRSDCAFVRRLDNQRKGAALYGGGFLLSDKAAADKAAADKAAADKAAAERVELSERERAIVDSLSRC